MSSEPKQGWTPQPNGRGTLDILQSCIITIFLCCWTSVYPNIPPKGSSKWTKFRNKLILASIGVLGPEFVLTLAFGQYSSARQSYKSFHEAGYTDWTITHAFFADMGGFILRSPDEVDIPLDAVQLLFLLSKGYIQYPDIAKEDIDDRNKYDGLARSLTIVQVLWFTANSIARPIQDLALTILELTTLSFILVMLATSCFWIHKPGDVSGTFVVETQVPISQISRDANHDPSTYYQYSPLEFISREEWPLSLMWAYYTQILKNILNIIWKQPEKRKPYDHIPSDNWPKPKSILIEALGGLVILAFSATFMIGWNFHFPTQVERMIWRVASVFNLGYGLVGGSIVWYWLELAPHHETRNSQDSPGNISRVREKGLTKLRILASKFISKLRNNSPDNDPQLEVPLRFFIPCLVLCFLYAIFRAYILIEDVIGLRSLPSSAYDSVDWSRYIPHI